MIKFFCYNIHHLKSVTKNQFGESKMIFAIAGRKHTGKTSICNILIEKGFKKASFATGLKEYVGKLYDWSQEDLNSQEGKENFLESPVLWDENYCKKLSSIIGINIQFKQKTVFKNRREALQHIGTEVLRDYDKDFHLKEFKKRFSEGNYVCDDVRFENELELLKSMKATCCFLLRPFYWSYNNHSSEISLSYKNFDYIFINDGSLKKLQSKAGVFFENILNYKKDKSKRLIKDRQALLNLLEKNNFDTGRCADALKCSRDLIVYYAVKYGVFILRNKYKLNHDAFNMPNFENSYWAGLLSADGSIKKHLKYDYLLEISSLDKIMVEGFKEFLNCKKNIYKFAQKTNGKLKYQINFSSPFLIEDLKKWNLEPKKSKFNKIPDCLRNDEYLFSQWLVGLIDGDGSIYFIKNKSGQIKNIALAILASKEIIDYVVDYLGLEGGNISQEKKIENLFNYRVVGKNAIKIYYKIYKGQGLERKWNKFEEFKKLYPAKFE
jgi:hypothetical protein